MILHKIFKRELIFETINWLLIIHNGFIPFVIIIVLRLSQIIGIDCYQSISLSIIEIEKKTRMLLKNVTNCTSKLSLIIWYGCCEKKIWICKLIYLWRINDLLYWVKYWKKISGTKTWLPCTQISSFYQKLFLVSTNMFELFHVSIISKNSPSEKSFWATILPMNVMMRKIKTYSFWLINLHILILAHIWLSNIYSVHNRQFDNS